MANQVIRYSKVPKCRFSNRDVQIIGPEITRIFHTHGESKPHVIVDEARPITSPLHPYFEWNDQKAAEEHRIDQARYILRCIQIEIIAPNSNNHVVVNIASSITRPQIGPVYQQTNVLLGNRSDRRQLLENAWAELRSFMNRYRDFVEFEPIFHVIRLQMRKHQ